MNVPVTRKRPISEYVTMRERVRMLEKANAALLEDIARCAERVDHLEAQRDRRQKAANDSLERARTAEAEAERLGGFRLHEVAAAVRKAEKHGPYRDLNHVLGVLVEELDEFKDDVRRNHAAHARLELYDIVGAAIKAIAQIERKELD